MQIYTCSAGNVNQQFSVTADNRIAWTGKGECLDLTGGSTTSGTLVRIYSECDFSRPDQLNLLRFKCGHAPTTITIKFGTLFEKVSCSYSTGQQGHLDSNFVLDHLYVISFTIGISCSAFRFHTFAACRNDDVVSTWTMQRGIALHKNLAINNYQTIIKDMFTTDTYH